MKIRQHWILSAALAWCLWATSAPLPAAAPVSLEPESAVRMALGKNPEMRAAREIVAEAEGRARATGRLSNPELETEVAGGQDFEGRIAIGITQRFPLTSRLRLERKLSALEIESARLEIRERERLLAAAVRTAFYNLLAARESAALARSQTTVARRFASTLEQGATQGFGSALEVGQATIDADTFAAAEQIHQLEEIEASATLSTLLGLPADTTYTPKGALTPPAAIPAKRPMGTRPDLLLAEMAVESGAVDVSLAKATKWEDIGAGVFVEGERFSDEPEGIEPEALVGVRLSVPLPLWQNGSGKVAEKKATHERKLRQAEALRLSAQNEVAMAYAVMKVRHSSATSTAAKLAASAQKQVTDAEAAYGRGEIDVQNVFRARDRLATAESDSLNARKAYFLSHSQWLAALGEPVSTP